MCSTILSTINSDNPSRCSVFFGFIKHLRDVWFFFPLFFMIQFIDAVLIKRVVFHGKCLVYRALPGTSNLASPRTFETVPEAESPRRSLFTQESAERDRQWLCTIHAMDKNDN